MTVVAAFDVDGTLTTRDCVVPFLRGVRGTPGLALGLARRAVPLIAAVVRRDRDGVKAVATAAALTGAGHDHVASLGARFAEHVATERLRGDTLARLHWHRARGHRVVLVSASYELYLGRLGELLGADAVIGTRVEVVGGRCTGRLDGPNCRGPEKVRRLHSWLDAHAGGRGAVELWAYGDSPGDRALLADADHAVDATGPVVSAPAGGER